MRTSSLVLLAFAPLLGCAGAQGPVAQPAAPVAARPAECVETCNATVRGVPHLPPLSECGGPTGGVLGKVVVEGQPPNVPIEVTATSTCGSFPLTARENGVFAFGALPRGIYIVEATIGTRASSFSEVTVRAGEVISMELELRADEVEWAREELAKREECGCPKGATARK